MKKTTTNEATRRLFARLETRLDVYRSIGRYPVPAPDPVDDLEGSS